MQELPWERMQIAIAAVAKAEAAIEWTRGYVNERKAFGQPVAASRTRASSWPSCDRSADRPRVRRPLPGTGAAGQADTGNGGMAKYWTTDLQCKVIDECVQLHGGYGYMWEFPVARAYVDARVQRIYGGTNEIMKEVISRSLGLGPERTSLRAAGR